MVYQAKCTKCGHLNTGLLLEDSHGYFECDSCKTVNRVVVHRSTETVSERRERRRELRKREGERRARAR